MIPSLNLNRLRCPPAPVIANAQTTPRSVISRNGSVVSNLGARGEDAAGNLANGDSSRISTDRRYPSDASGREASAIRSGAIDATDFLGVEIDVIDDVTVLRKKLHEARGLLVALDAWYAARLAEKEQIMLYRLAQLTAMMEPTAEGGRLGSPVATRRPSSGSPRVATARTPERPVSPGSASRCSNSRGAATARSPGTKSPPPGAAVHPKPFNVSIRKPAPTPYVPPTNTTSPRLTAAGRVPSLQHTPMSTPRGNSARGGQSPLDPSPGNSARSVGGANSARRAAGQTVNWSSTIPSVSLPHTSNAGPIGAVVQRGTVAVPPLSFSRVTGGSRSSVTNDERRAVTPRF